MVIRKEKHNGRNEKDLKFQLELLRKLYAGKECFALEISAGRPDLVEEMKNIYGWGEVFRKEADKQKRGDWGTINPITRTIPDKRNKMKEEAARKEIEK